MHDSFLIKEILSSRVLISQYVNFNTVPLNSFTELMEVLRINREYGNLNHLLNVISNTISGFVGNMLLFVPFGLLLPMASNRFRRLGYLLLISVIASITIELLQLIQQVLFVTSWRVVDIDDVIANTLGAAIGWYINIKCRKPS